MFFTRASRRRSSAARAVSSTRVRVAMSHAAAPRARSVLTSAGPAAGRWGCRESRSLRISDPVALANGPARVFFLTVARPHARPRPPHGPCGAQSVGASSIPVDARARALITPARGSTDAVVGGVGARFGFPATALLLQRAVIATSGGVVHDPSTTAVRKPHGVRRADHALESCNFDQKLLLLEEILT